MTIASKPGANDDVVRIFVSYAREDRRWLDPDYRFSLIPFLIESLRRLNVAFWFDKELKPGDEFRQFIESEIDQSQIALLIVSQSFLNSEFIENREMPRIAERARLGKTIVVPVLVEPCDWSEYSFLADRQMVPSSPLINYTDNDAKWATIRFQILDGVKAQVKRIREAQKPSAQEAPARVREAARPVTSPAGMSPAGEAPRTVREPDKTRSKSRPPEEPWPMKARKLFLAGLLMLSFGLVAGNFGRFADDFGLGAFGHYLNWSPFLGEINYALSRYLGYSYLAPGSGFHKLLTCCFAIAGPGFFIAGLGLCASRRTRVWGAMLAALLLLSLALWSGFILMVEIRYMNIFVTRDWGPEWNEITGEFFKFAMMGALLMAARVERERHARAGWWALANRWTVAGRYIFGASLLLYLTSRARFSAWYIHHYGMPTSSWGAWPYTFLETMWWGTPTAFVLSPAIIVACVCIFYPRWRRIAAICFSALSIAFVPLLYVAWWGQVPSGDPAGMFVIWAGDVGLAGGVLLWTASLHPKTVEASEPAGVPTLQRETAPVGPH